MFQEKKKQQLGKMFVCLFVVEKALKKINKKLHKLFPSQKSLRFQLLSYLEVAAVRFPQLLQPEVPLARVERRGGGHTRTLAAGS